MNIPFTLEQFLDVFRRYNQAVWPVQVLLIALAVLALAAAMSGGSRASRVASLIVSLFWLWAGVVYHFVFFRDINGMATVFAVAFVIEALLFLWFGVVRGSLTFDARGGWSTVVGATIIAYSLVLYPLIGLMLDHKPPSAPTFGVPCPTTIFTFGLIVWLKPPRSRVLLVVPVLWSIVALTAAIRLGMWEDLGLTIAAGVALATTLLAPHKQPTAVFPQLL